MHSIGACRAAAGTKQFQNGANTYMGIFSLFQIQTNSDSDELGSKARVEEEGRSPCIDRYTVLSTHTDTTHAEREKEREREREREGEREREREGERAGERKPPT